jgi:hypothetical protein
LPVWAPCFFFSFLDFLSFITVPGLTFKRAIILPSSPPLTASGELLHLLGFCGQPCPS